MTESINFIEIAARQSITIPSKLAIQLSRMGNVDDLRGFLDDVSAAEASATILMDTELHKAAVRRLERLGFGEADYAQSKQIMLGIIFSTEIATQLNPEKEAEAMALRAA